MQTFSKSKKVKDTLKQFVIPFSGLKLGTYSYQFNLDKTFFEHFENEDIKDANLVIDLTLEKKSTLMELGFNFQGIYSVECSRCLQEYNQEVSGNESLIVKFGEEMLDEPDIIFIPHHETSLDLREVIYEMAVLLLPMVCVHPDDKNGNSLCDPEMLKKISEHAAKNIPDSQWDQLKNLLN